MPPPTVAAIVADYEDAQIKALKTGFLVAAFLVLASFFAARGLRPSDLVRPNPAPGR